MDRLLEATYRAEAEHFWFRGFRRFVRPLLAQATAGVTSPRLLDCGCGTGANLRLLDQSGHAYGLDLTWTGLHLARRSGLTRIARGSVSQLPFADHSFDVVTSFDVIYSLPEAEERAAISEMYRVLRAGGAALINVAALDILRGNHSILCGEVRRYDKHRLRSALEAAGFLVRRLTYTNAVLFPLMLVARGLQRARGLDIGRAERDLTVPARPINGILSAALAVEAVALRWVDMPVGSSLLCLAHKPEARRSASAPVTIHRGDR